MADQKTVDSLLAESGGNIADHLQLLADLGQEFATSLDIEATLARAIERITGYLDAAGGALFMLEDGGATLRCHACFGATEITGFTLPSDQGIVGRCVQAKCGAIVRDVAADPDFDASADRRTGFTTRSILCAPLSVRDETIGAIELVNKRGGDGLFTEADLAVLQALSSSAALAIINARMAAALVEQERVRVELEMAAEIQKSLLPAPAGDDFPVRGITRSAHTMSGDFYDYFRLGDGRICFNLGDVSGKGMNAALLMAKTASLFRCLGRKIHAPGRLLAELNVELCETATRGMFVTMVGGVYDPARRTVCLANAGHEPPLLHAAAGGFTAFPAEAPPLGIMPLAGPDDTYPEREVVLDGGALYVFTDGVTEGYLEDGTTLEVEGLKSLIARLDGLGLTDRLEAIVARLDRGDALRDDVTVLVVEDASLGR